ncbi:hypothetical protein DdX_17848 [Ditylenchus destructor]|uniref:Abnormal cell migration protein 18-like fibronectin type I domain-containing protein n=1 Tax=Ditylenchus destructor TaxID=166010 RepID=A0AAD4MR64_9BILA|nr:hypothetical protein DdX_17848 [Ditylenchus destructor]
MECKIVILLPVIPLLINAGVPEYLLKHSEISEGCFREGQQFGEGEEFLRSFLRYKCVNGRAKIIGCYIDESRMMSAGDDVVDWKRDKMGMVHRCFVGDDGRIAYQEYPCGFLNNPPCEPLGKPLSVNRMDTLSLQAPK